MKSRVEQYIQDYTRCCSNQIDYSDINRKGFTPVTPVKEYHPWLTPDNARSVAQIAREEVMDKVIGWIEEINNHHHIMRYSDSCEPPINELIEWFKNYMKEGGEQ